MSHGGYVKCKGWRLPTEAEWEYAFGADSGRSYYWDTDDVRALQSFEDAAWIQSGVDAEPGSVGSREGNKFGLYDMSGNAREWTNDWYSNYSSEFINPTGPLNGIKKVQRGGSYRGPVESAGARVRESADPEEEGAEIGFRVVRR